MPILMKNIELPLIFHLSNILWSFSLLFSYQIMGNDFITHFWNISPSRKLSMLGNSSGVPWVNPWGGGHQAWQFAKFFPRLGQSAKFFPKKYEKARERSDRVSRRAFLKFISRNYKIWYTLLCNFSHNFQKKNVEFLNFLQNLYL